MVGLPIRRGIIHKFEIDLIVWKFSCSDGFVDVFTQFEIDLIVWKFLNDFCNSHTLQSLK